MKTTALLILAFSFVGLAPVRAAAKADAPAAAEKEKAAPENGPEDVHAPRPRTGPLNPPAPPQAGEPINDKAVYRFLEIEGEKLIEAGKTLGAWRTQLDRRTCALKLPPSGKRKFTPAEIAARAEQSVVILGTFYLCGKCSRLHMATASGFFLNESGALATCRHVLGGYSSNSAGIVVLTRDGRLCPVREVLAADPLNDLVILQVEGRGFTPLPLSEDAPPGSSVTLVSHPDGRFFSISTGIVSRRSALRRKDGVVQILSITADFAKGSSGAPVCNESGAVVGVVDNTQSIYYDSDRGRQENLQMVFKNCAPAAALRQMIKKP